MNLPDDRAPSKLIKPVIDDFGMMLVIDDFGMVLVIDDFGMVLVIDDFGMVLVIDTLPQTYHLEF